MARFLVAVLLTALAGGVLGCGSGELELAPAKGQVFYNGKPLADANVVFTPSTGRPARGVTDSEGRFQLSTFEDLDGAKVGPHTVTITKSEKVDMPPESASKGPPDPTKIPTPKRLIPAKYAHPSTSGLTAQVTDDEAANDFKFELTGE